MLDRCATERLRVGAGIERDIDRIALDHRTLYRQRVVWLRTNEGQVVDIKLREATVTLIELHLCDVSQVNGVGIRAEVNIEAVPRPRDDLELDTGLRVVRPVA